MFATVQFWQVAIGTALCLALVAFFVLHFFPLRRLQQYLKRLVDEDYSAALLVRATPAIRRMSNHIEALRERLVNQRQQISDEGFSLRAILSSMSEGVLIADPGKNVRLVNATLVDMFDIKVSPLNKTVMEVFRIAQLNETLNRAIASRLPQRVDFSVMEGGYDSGAIKYFAVNAVAVEASGESDQPLGIVAVFHDITELRKQQTYRQELMANVSHELRTPLSIISGYIETLLDDGLDDPAMARDFLVTMQKHCERLKYLIEDTMTISQLESQAPGLQLQEVSLRDCLERVLERLEPAIQRQGASIRLDLPESLPPVSVDVDRLDQVFFNLLDNALKYSTARDLVIRISGRQEGDNLVMEFEDNGPGIAPAHRDSIFERFYRVAKDRSRDTGGTGLGLAIVKNVMLAHGGAVRVEKSQLGGANFILTLPLHDHNQLHVGAMAAERAYE